MNETDHNEVTDPTLKREDIDLNNCDREPIHIPGSIQPHGVLVALDAATRQIRQVSANAGAFFGQEAKVLAGQPADTFLSAEDAAVIDRLEAGGLLEGMPQYLPAKPGADGRKWERLVHRHSGRLILEYEAWDDGQQIPGEGLYPAVRSAMGALQANGTLTDYCQLAAEQFRGFSGFDRVMVYRFLNDGAGKVIAEAKREDLEPFLGLHYPATDIPQQARRLFYNSWLRLLPDTRCEPVPMLAADETEPPLDMSYAAVRAISPIHMEYLQHMGVFGSMSVSIREGGQLWGLFACHHYSAHYMPHEARMACEMLAHMLSLQVAEKERGEQQAYLLRLKEANASIAEAADEAALEGNDFAHGLATRLLRGMDADGAAAHVQGFTSTTGRVPGAKVLGRVVAWLDANPARMVFQTTDLAGEAPGVGASPDTAAGLLAVRLSKFRPDYLFWFRGEYLHEVTWAGDPSKSMEPVKEDEGVRLSPRKSFASWKEQVRGKSKPWVRAELECAAELRRHIMEIVARRSERLMVLNEQLERAHRELDSFTTIAAHDLSEPLRGIRYFTEFLHEDHADKIGDGGLEMLQTIQKLTGRMETLVSGLLTYVHAGHEVIRGSAVDMEAELSAVLETLGPALGEAGVQIEPRAPLPHALGDRVLLGEIWQNLLGNAIKYRHDGTHPAWVKVTCREAVDEESAGILPGQGLFWRYTVEDNGIGIAVTQQDEIFTLFRRLHGRGERGGGAGMGLAMSRRIVERHGGRLWVESEPGKGSSFHFLLPRVP